MSCSQYEGIFITFEGIDGSGKSTQLELLADKMDDLYWKDTTKTIPKYVSTREPGGTPLADQLRAMIKYHKPDAEKMTDFTELMLILCARAQHVANVITPALNRGEIVLCDRFTDSTLAYQKYGRDRMLDMRTLYEAMEGVTPDVTFLIDISLEERAKRILARDGASAVDRLESMDNEFHKRVREGYLSIARSHKNRIMVLDGSHSVEELHKEIIQHLATEFDMSYLL